MSDSDNMNDAVQRIRDAFDDVVEEAEEVSEQAQAGVHEAIDDLEARIESLRDDE